MKQVLIVCAVFLLMTTGSWAAGQSAVSFAIKGGINPADQVLDPDPETQDGKLLRFGGGVTLGLEFSPSFSLDTDFLYVMKGAQYKFDISTALGDAVMRTECDLDYFVINPMFRITLKPSGASPYFMVGPEFGYLVNAEWIYDPTPGAKATFDAKEEFKDTDLALNIGGGLDFPAQGTTSFFFEGRYSMGMNNILVEPAGTESGEGPSATAKNRGIYVFGGIRF